jgi:RNA polymerase sigma-70 factor (ECF subfamily)
MLCMTEPPDNWPERLRGNDKDRDAALGSLRLVLVRGLGAALARRAVDDGFIDDVVQDTLVKVLARLHQFEGRSQFTTWALTIALRTAFTELRRRRWQEVSLDDLLEAAPERLPAFDAPDPGAAASPERREAIWQAARAVIARDLTARQRQGLLAELSGMPVVRLAEALQCSPNALYKLLHDARKALRRGLDAAGVTGADILETFPG